MAINETHFQEFVQIFKNLVEGGGGMRPSTLEGVGMALAGIHLAEPVGPAINSLATSMNEVAIALDRIADILEEACKKVG